jgi:hypothetical protein
MEKTKTLIGWWREYHEQGLTIFPLKKGGKNPGTDFGIKWQKDWIKADRPTYPDLASTYETATYGLWLATGQISKRVALDVDSPEAEAFWREKIGDDVFDRALKVTSGRRDESGFVGKHLHFSLREDDARPWAGHSDDDLGYDFRGEGGGVVMPPSVHKTGRVYEWVEGELLDAPECLRKENQPKRISGNVSTGGSGTTLAQELMRPPDDSSRGNNWLARVAGFEAKAERRFYDRYLARMMNYNWASLDPIEEGPFMKTVESIWRAEHSKVEEPVQGNGWLVGDGEKLYTLCEIGAGDDKKLVRGEWADFDIRVKSITRSVDGTQVYTVDLITTDGVQENLQLDPAIFSTEAKLAGWLNPRGAVILPQPYDKYAGYPHRARLNKYVKAQEATASNAVRHLGWNSTLQQFIAHDGIVTADGIAPHEGSVPDAILTSWAPYNYGTVSQDEAVEVLREVMTFQDETVTSVFGSWWAMALLKGQYQASQFPFMSIEAPSESGKSTGFFAMMVALAGNTNGHGQYTAPAFRDALAGHRNGITWLDDMTEMGDLQDMIRQLTAEGYKSKKGTDRRETEAAQLLCPLVISGEGLGSVMSEKAMRDRAVSLEISSPKDRMSLKDPTRKQWDDIEALQQHYGGKPSDLSKVAGTIVGLVLSRASMLADLSALRTSSGRHGDKMAIIRMGARILADVTGDESHVERVDAWCSGQGDGGNINYVIAEIVPWFLRANLMPTSANGHQAVYWDDKTATVWVSPARLADAWRARQGLSPRERQLGAEDAIRAELKANGVDSNGKAKWVDRINKRKAKYLALTDGIAELVMGRAGQADEIEEELPDDD